LYRFLAITVLLDVKDIPQVGPLQWGWITRADYCNWSFNTLRKLAEAMDARIRVLIEAAEDVLPEYEAEANMPRQLRASAATEMADVRQRLPSQSAATAITRHAVELPAMSKEYGISHDRKQSSYLSHSDASSERTTVPA
jgi:hypothetical protein